MSAIDFVVRDSAGNLQRGSVAGDGPQGTVIVGAGDDISLNLYKNQIAEYDRNGQALEVHLVDGRVIVIEGFYSPDGVAENKLFISADGQLSAVDLTQLPDGAMQVAYNDEDPFGKWSPDDALYFIRGEDIQMAYDAEAGVADDHAGMLATPVMGALGGLFPWLGIGGAAAGAAIIGGGGGGGGGGDGGPHPAPHVEITGGTEGAGDVVNQVDYSDGVEITGNGDPGATVTVTIGDKSHETLVTEDGHWEVVFTTDEVAPGEYTEPVTVTISNGNGSATVTDTLVVDTVAHVSFDASHVEGDGVVNREERADGVVLTGTVEAGSTVVVTTGGMDYTATVTGGTWTVTLPATNVAFGEYTLPVTVTATDAVGNTATVTDTIRIDTETTIVMATGFIGGDGVISAAEQAAGVTVTGFAEAGASVVVTLGTAHTTVTAGADGAWTAGFTPAQIPTGTYNATVTAVSTDAAGNHATATGTVHVDTEMTLTVDTAHAAGNGVINAAEAAAGVALTGTSEPGATVTVSMNGHTHTATATAQGTWSVTFTSSEIPPGTYSAPVSVSAVDAVGNSQSLTATMQVDTEASVAFSTTPVATDGIINAVEAANGVLLTGTTQPGSTVIITMGGVSLPATVNAGGQWSVTMPSSAMQSGEYMATVTANATDPQGNTASATMTVQVDTQTGVALTGSNAGADGVLNAAERAGGLTLTGTAEPGATVAVTMGAVTHTVIATSTGTWSATWSTNEVPQGETTAAVTVRSTDLAGNVATTAGAVQIDTYVNSLSVTSARAGGDGVVNQTEAAQPITLSGVVEAGSSVNVSLGGQTLAATVGQGGTWTVTFPAGSLPGGEYTTQMVVNATDRAGNTTNLTESVRVDTIAGDLTLSNLPIEGDDVVNAVEVSDGVRVFGTATPGLTVTVTFGAATHQVLAGPDGTWSSVFAHSEIPDGTYDTPITARITDDAGNTKLVTDSVHIDTQVDNFGFAAGPIAGDNIISGAERLAGVSVGGTVEPGSTVVVHLGTATRTVLAGADGNWTTTFTAGQIPQGETNLTMSATATDRAGNTADITQDVRVDTVVNRLTAPGPVETDNIVNAAEAADGINLGGRVEVGSTVQVTMAGVTHAAAVDSVGNWTVHFTGAEIPRGDYTAQAVIAATDAVGNTASITQTFAVDTIAPEAPHITATDISLSTGLRSISVAEADVSLQVYRVGANGTVQQLGIDPVADTRFYEVDLYFDTPVSDGKQLVVTSTDTAGNQGATLFVLDQAGTNLVNLHNTGLDRFNIETIDLRAAKNAELTLTETDLKDLAQTSDTVTILGGSDDTVTITGAVNTGGVQTIDHQTYHVYSLGTEGASLIIHEDIHVIV